MAVDVGAREEHAGRAALHVPLAAGVVLAKGARLPLPWYVRLATMKHHHHQNQGDSALNGSVMEIDIDFFFFLCVGLLQATAESAANS